MQIVTLYPPWLLQTTLAVSPPHDRQAELHIPGCNPQLGLKVRLWNTVRFKTSGYRTLRICYTKLKIFIFAIGMYDIYVG